MAERWVGFLGGGCREAPYLEASGLAAAVEVEQGWRQATGGLGGLWSSPAGMGHFLASQVNSLLPLCSGSPLGSILTRRAPWLRSPGR